MVKLLVVEHLRTPSTKLIGATCRIELHIRLHIQNITCLEIRFYLRIAASAVECSDFKQRIADGSVDVTYHSKIDSSDARSSKSHGKEFASCRIVISCRFSLTFGSLDIFTKICKSVETTLDRVA